MKARAWGWVALTLVIWGLASCSGPRTPSPDARVAYAGLRCSNYGITPFPDTAGWGRYVAEMERLYPGSVGTFVWIVGYVNGNAGTSGCTVNFPVDPPVQGVEGFPLDENEAFLTFCDQKGYRVWLQVEPGDSDLASLAEQTLRRYRHHPSVTGFGVDVEWYHPSGTDGFGVAITDELARDLDTRIKAVDPRFRLFLKHWDARWMPPTYRSDILFVNDSQGHETLTTMEGEFQKWAAKYHPNPVAFQIGYESDEDLWGPLENPVQALGKRLAEGVPRGQELSLIWVDFTLRKVMEARGIR